MGKATLFHSGGGLRRVPLVAATGAVVTMALAGLARQRFGFDAVALLMALVVVLGVVSLPVTRRLWAAEDRARESDALFRSFFQHSLDAWALHQLILNDNGDPVDYVFLEANPSFERHTGLKVADIIGQPVTQVLPGVERTPFIETYGRVVLTGEPARFQQYSPPLKRHYEIVAFPVEGQRFAVMFTDITEKRRLQLELQATREQYHSILEKQEDLVCCFQPDTTLTYANAAYMKFFSLTDDDMGTKQFLTLIPREDHAWVRRNMFYVAAAGKPMTYEHKVVTDGQVYWYSWTDYPVIDEQGSLQGFRSVGRDITKRKTAEMAQQEYQTKYLGLLENCPDGVLIVAIEGTIVDCNEQAASMFGYRREELLHLPVSTIQAPGGTPAFPDDTHIRYLRQHRSTEYQASYRRKDGNFFSLRFAISLLDIAGEEFILMFQRHIPHSDTSQAAPENRQRDGAVPQSL